MLAELTNHVWQSSVFALLVGLMTAAFRYNRAGIRYGLWLSASCKFLVPFAFLMSLGQRLEWRPALPNLAPGTNLQLTLWQVSQPFPQNSRAASLTGSAHDWLSVAIFAIWTCGFVTVVLIRVAGWLRIRAVLRSSTPLDIPAPIEIRSSPGLLEPGVVGLFRPILLLPANIKERLQPPEFEAVLAHELCHARRRDNVTSVIHMIVEALFWFHPLIWWIGARLIEERERACDEEVLRLGSTPRDYAEGILKICQSYLEAPLACVSGVTGSDIKKRIHAILAGRATWQLSWAKKATLTFAGLLAVSTPIALGILSAPPRLHAQSPQAAEKFAAASVKPCEAFRKGNSQDLQGETFHSECTTLERLIEQAYGLFADGHMNPGASVTVSGGPAWTTSDLYEIDAKTASPQTRAMMNGPMLQALLEDRFQLHFHREVTEGPVYTLTVAEGGPKLQPFQGTCIVRDFDKPPSDADCATAQGYGNGFRLNAATIADLCAGFSVFLDRHVIDKTGIEGRFDIYVDLSGEDHALLIRPRSLPALSNPTAPAPSVPFDAVENAMKKIGLNLQPSEAPGESLVIDHVARPSEN